ncbi:hypothetical protein CDL12_26499 [Handroanthus impetiginosus]|uniref:Uncharacterized protein n=1 Tax=Handroanthus impetiginosus TaxID=429701 RepID=A0A2G9G6R3_9LAMI|nr:hypothetical protein CDL12_26499 [Handroanthus impetiginosus]
MSFSNWRNLRSKSVRLGQKDIQSTEQQDYSNQKWLMFWRKIRRAKIKKSSYDHESYLQNFDEESAERIHEPDNLYRSFSARYAANFSRFNHRKLDQLIDIDECR